MTLPQVSGYQKGQQFPLWHKADISMQARVCPLLGDCVAKLGFFFASGNCSVSFDHPIVSAAV
jgi:hypothetical protein